MNNRYPDRVDKENRPEVALQNIPDDVVEKALNWAVRYGACPECGEEQFYPELSGHNTEWDCRECGHTMRIVG